MDPVPPIKSAVIPAAGFGPQLFPATKALRPELFPVVDSRGTCKPMIYYIVDELIHAGIETIVIVVQVGLFSVS